MRFQNYINEYIDNDKFIDGSIWQFLKESKPYFDLIRKNNVQNKFLWRGISNTRLKNGFGKLKTRKNREPLDTCIKLHNILNDSFKKYTGIKARSETVFCIPNKKVTKVYGKPFIMIPIGKFDYIWSPKINDLYYYIEQKYFDDILKPLCFKESMYNEWLYDKNTENDEWVYNDINTNTSDIEKAKKFIIKDIMKELNISKKEAEEIFDEKMLKPKHNYKEYINLKEKNAVNIVNKIVKNNYVKNKGFKQLMDTYKNEVMIDCDYYYLIDSNETKLIKELENSI